MKVPYIGSDTNLHVHQEHNEPSKCPGIAARKIVRGPTEVGKGRFFLRQGPETSLSCTKKEISGEFA